MNENKLFVQSILDHLILSLLSFEKKEKIGPNFLDVNVIRVALRLGYLMVLTVLVLALPNLLHGVNCLYQGMLIPCQSHHDAYACIPGRAVVSGGDGMDSST
jgi:hypothetical protein